MKHKTALIIPVYNRRLITLKALDTLERIGISGKADIIVVDDASSDGTAEEIAQTYPEVIVLKGSGGLYWTGAVEMGMKFAIEAGTECCVWMNDDLELGPNAIESIVQLAMETGAMVTAQGITERGSLEALPFALLYRGGSRLIGKTPPAEPSPDPIEVDTCRGNLVAIPRTVVERIGYPDGENIPHLGGDTDYGLRATAAGIKCYTLTEAVFYETEAFRDDRKSWLLGDQPIRKILGQNLAKRGALYPRMVVVYNLRHWKLRGLPNLVVPYLKLILTGIVRKIVPKSVLLKLFAKYSESYQFGKDVESRR